MPWEPGRNKHIPLKIPVAVKEGFLEEEHSFEKV
jgi:hypothetical protein